MVVQLRSLRVEASLDPGGYNAGAQQVVDANTAMARSYAAADAAQSRLPAGLARLTREFVPGYREAEKFHVVLDRLNRSMGEGMGLERAVAILGNLEKALGRVVTRSEAAQMQLGSVAQAASVLRGRGAIDEQFGIGRAPARSASDAAEVLYAAQAAEIERLTNAARLLKMEIDPLGSAQDRLNAELLEYRQMANAGVITTEQLGVATQNAHVRFAQAAENARRMGNNVRLGRHEVANLSYQLNDVAVMLASGQSPFMLIMQQGGQIAQILGPYGLRGGVKALGQGIMEFLISPMNLAVLGVAALAVGSVYAFGKMQSAAKSTEDILSEQKRLLSDINSIYGSIGVKAADLGRDSFKVLQFEARLNIEDSKKRILEDLRTISAEVDPGFVANRFAPAGKSIPLAGPLPGINGSYTNPERLPFKKALDELRDGIVKGKPDLVAFREQIEAIANAPGASEELKSIARNAIAASGPVKDLALQMQQLEKAIDPAFASMQIRLSTAASLLGAAREAIPLRSLIPDTRSKNEQLEETLTLLIKNASSVKEVESYTDLAAQAQGYFNSEVAKTKTLLDLEIQSIYAKTPAQKAEIAAMTERANLINSSMDETEKAIRINHAYRMAYEQNSFAISEQTRLLRQNAEIEIQSINARSPAQKAQIAALRERTSALEQGASAEVANTRAAIASSVAYAQAQKAIADADKQRLRAANDNIAQQSLEAKLVGATAYERQLATSNLQTYLDLLRQAELNGLSFDQKQYDLLVAKNREMAKAAELSAANQLFDDLKNRKRLLGMSDQEGEDFSTLRGSGLQEGSEYWERAKKELREIRDIQNGVVYGAKQGFADIAASAANMGQTIRDGINAFYDAGEQAFVGLFKTGKLNLEGLADTAKEILGKLVYQMIMSGLFRLVGLQGGGVGFGNFNILGSANGNAFSGGSKVSYFARGGTFENSIVNKPTPFQYGNNLGVMGEAGPEAVVPLKRTSDGRLGIAATGQKPNVNLNVQYFGQNPPAVSQTTESDGSISLVIKEMVQKQAEASTVSTLRQFGFRKGKSY